MYSNDGCAMTCHQFKFVALLFFAYYDKELRPI